MKEYKWVAHQGDGWRFLEDAVPRHLNDGWEPVGGPFFFEDKRRNNEEWWIQAMMRTRESIESVRCAVCNHVYGSVDGYTDASNIYAMEECVGWEIQRG